jgi:glycine/D-amino acid oxidase-like deaminating enzyme/nitrite reductase/ring-hydroxylating ferredoxin subunit
MPSESGRTTSIWMATAAVPHFDPLQADTRADVCVVGGGIAGLTTAYLLAREGLSVVVLDDNPIGGGETGRTTAHLSSAMDEGFDSLERMHGEQGARLAYESHNAAVDRIEEIVKVEAIDCDFTRLDGYLFLAPGHTQELLEKERDAAQRAGFADVEFVPRVPLPGFDPGRCLRFPRQGQFHVLKYLDGLARVIRQMGGRIHTGSHVASVEGGTPARVSVKDGPTVTADRAVVVCTNSPINDWVKIHTKQAPYRTYAIGARIPTGTVLTALYWDTNDPYHYIRLQRVRAADGSAEQDILIVGGEDHKTAHGEETTHFGALEAWARGQFPMIEAIDFQWSGQVLEPFDGLAFIGRNPGDKDNVYIATGDSGQGMTHGTIAGLLNTDLIQGRDNPWAKLYDPARKMHRSLGAFVAENFDVAARYAEWVTPGEIRSPGDLAPGQGALMRKGLAKLAVYKDAQGQVHTMSATCPHLGCLVHWNDVEKSWDCPCHGSRFDAHGKVINGPANVGLEAK